MEFISVCFLFFLFLLMVSLFCFFSGLFFLLNEFSVLLEWEIFSINSSKIEMIFFFDWMSLIFISFVMFISSLVIYYSKDYMLGDMNLNRFIFMVILFIISMFFLIVSVNLISILLGWDGLGLVSYCLVIYYQNVKSYNAGMLTALSNRLGDVAFLIAIAWMMNFGSWNFLFYIEFMKFDFSMKMIGLLMIFAAMTKSAQIPFSSWLPAAMAAPTPVSALVHSSTLVTAGVYLLIRFNILLVDSFESKFLLFISGLTMFMAGLGANFEFDLKKIIALSTLSQLGLMMSILSMGFSKLAFFHLLTHALFKALLFMCAGVIIHNVLNSQDIRSMGNLMYSMPFTLVCLNIANLALCGFPFLAGFFSKDLILEMVLISKINIVIFFLFFFSTGLTVSYSIRLFYFCFIYNFFSSSLNLIFDFSLVMQKSMISLLIFAISGGSFMNWVIFPFSYLICLSFFMKILTLLVCFLGGLLGFFMSMNSFFFSNKSLNFYNFFFFLSSMWFLPFLSTVGVTWLPLKMGKILFKNLDQGWMEFFGIQATFKYFLNFSIFNQFIQFNFLKIYLNFFFLWIIFLFFFT